MATSISLKSLLVPSKTVDVDYPGMPGFKISVSFLSRETLVKIRKNATRTSYKNRVAVDEVNDDEFLKQYVKESIKGWKGLTLTYLEQLAPVDLTGQDMAAELEFTEENALFLMKSSSNFDAFISETVTDLGNFQKSNDKK